MAFVCIAGFPCSGKSTRARELERFLLVRLADSPPALRRLKVTIINDESLRLEKSVYDDSQSEKPARAALFSAVLRVMDKNTIVIVDAMNYIKGSRYQMYCAARESQVRMATLFVAATPAHCLAINADRSHGSYAVPTIENLISRFEEPSSAARWDSPLFAVPTQDLAMDATDPETGAFTNPESERIWEALTTGFIKPPNVATLAVKTSSPTYLTLLESLTSLIITSILQAQNSSSAPLSSTSLVIPTSPPLTIHLALPKMVTLPMLTRLKKQFTKLNMQAQNQTNALQQTGELGQDSLARLFADYLEANS